MKLVSLSFRQRCSIRLPLLTQALPINILPAEPIYHPFPIYHLLSCASRLMPYVVFCPPPSVSNFLPSSSCLTSPSSHPLLAASCPSSPAFVSGHLFSVACPLHLNSFCLKRVTKSFFTITFYGWSKSMPRP